MNSLWAVVLALAPSVGIGFLFYKVMKALLEGDRNERLAHARWEAGLVSSDKGAPLGSQRPGESGGRTA
ncbi:hypothetical protein AUCHE_03_01660 [Austwickia chelonae NBRC 105200]|uniref:Uncharacterized protein n=1 Tax=Austwickia chelonae NBRC 105200 TaxID=1184607 RepID=K6V477_9MICO|nr:hypothetical protein AUCHE_03_01660 [Austwickia chelonae NBRC 105200]